MNSINWPASSVWVFIAQLGEHCSANAEATGSNPVEAPKIFFFRAIFAIAKIAIHCDGHILISKSDNTHYRGGQVKFCSKCYKQVLMQYSLAFLTLTYLTFHRAR